MLTINNLPLITYKNFTYIKKLSLTCRLSTVTQKGFTLIEIVIASAVMLILLTMATLNFTSIQHKTTLASTVEIFLADLGQQQIKAMIGDTEGRVTTDNYGIHILSTNYTLFYGTYSLANSANFIVTLPTGQQASTTFSNSDVIFQKGSGEILNYSATQNTITLRDTSTGEQKVIQMNRYGVITGVN